MYTLLRNEKIDDEGTSKCMVNKAFQNIQYCLIYINLAEIFL